MLVLTRKVKQQIRLGDDIIVTVLRVKGNSIRLGIEAPRDTRVVRGELDIHVEDLEEASKKEAKHDFSKAVPEGGSYPRALPSKMITETPSKPLNRFMPKSVREVVGNVSV